MLTGKVCNFIGFQTIEKVGGNTKIDRNGSLDKEVLFIYNQTYYLFTFE